MADLTVSAVSVSSGPVSEVIIRADLVDSRGVAVQGFDASDNAYISPSVAATNALGTAVLSLVPNADITPSDTFYTIYVGDFSARILKTADPQTLREALVSAPIDL